MKKLDNAYVYRINNLGCIKTYKIHLVIPMVYLTEVFTTVVIDFFILLPKVVISIFLDTLSTVFKSEMHNNSTFSFFSFSLSCSNCSGDGSAIYLCLY